MASQYTLINPQNEILQYLKILIECEAGANISILKTSVPIQLTLGKIMSKNNYSKHDPTHINSVGANDCNHTPDHRSIH